LPNAGTKNDVTRDAGTKNADEPQQTKADSSRSRFDRSLLQEPLAIVAVECRLPQAESIGEYWDLLRNGRSAVTPFPETILPRERYYDATKGVRGKSYTTKGGLIKQRPLDWGLLGLDEAATLEWDECHLIFAEVAAKAWKSLPLVSHKNVGVYIGHSGGSRRAGDMVYATMAPEVAQILESIPEFKSFDSETQNRIADAWLQRMQVDRPVRLSGGCPHIEASAAARLVAEVCNLQGPQMVLDAACASSLVALALAAIDLQAGSIDAAIVGGASYNKVDSHILFSQAQSCSAHDSRPFDQAADGLIAAEGYIAIVIKTLRRAVDEGDNIRGVIRGIGIATDGRGKSLWAPRREGQFNAMERAYDCGISPSDVQFVEAHATSTQVGDATETQALTDFFRDHHHQGSLPVGSVKSNIGHTLETAGLAGLLKTILAMENAEIPPTINLKNLSDEIDWANAPFFVPTKLVPWITPDIKKVRCGAVNAFGIGGLNVHVVVEQYSEQYHANVIKSLPSKIPAAGNSQDPSGKSEPTGEPIAIVGLGVILPGAQSAQELSQLLSQNKSYIVPQPKGRYERPTDTKGSISGIEVTTFDGGYLTDYQYDWKRHRVPPKQVAQANPLQFMLLDAAGQALESVETVLGTDGNKRTSVIVGTVFGGEFAHQLQIGLRLHDLRYSLLESLDEVLPKHPSQIVLEIKKEAIVDAMEARLVKVFPALLDETGSFTSSTLASRITKQFHLLGGAMAIDAGNCSSDAALHTAVGFLRNHSSDAVLCAGGQRAMDFLSYEALASQGLLGKSDSGCFVPGEGAVVVLLKRLSDAKSNGDRIRGIIHDISVDHEVGFPKKQRNSSKIDSIKSDTKESFNHCEITDKTGDLQGAQGIASLAACLCNSAIQEGAHVSLVSSSRTGLFYRTMVSKGAFENNAVSDSKPKVQSTQSPKFTSEKPQPVMAAQVTADIPYRSLPKFFEWNRPCIAAVFPGQGSQYDEMLQAVANRSASARSVIRRANTILASMGSASIEQLAKLACSANTTPYNRIWPI